MPIETGHKSPVGTLRNQAPTHLQSLISDLILAIEQIAWPMALYMSRLANSQWGIALLATTMCCVLHDCRTLSWLENSLRSNYNYWAAICLWISWIEIELVRHSITVSAVKYYSQKKTTELTLINVSTWLSKFLNGQYPLLASIICYYILLKLMMVHTVQEVDGMSKEKQARLWLCQ